MGKRELLLIVGFLIAGVIVYQATAPPPKSGEERVSISRVFGEIRRAVHGNRGHAEVVHSNTYPVSPAVTELHLMGPYSDVTVIGGERQDIASEFRVSSTGFDESEARNLADLSVIKVDAAGPTLNFEAKYPREGRQNGSVTLKVPSRFVVRIEQSGARTSVTGVANAEIVSGHGETTLKQITGRAALTQRGGRVTVEDAGSLRLSSRAGGDARVTRIGGDASFDVQGGRLEATDILGAIDIDARGTDLILHAQRARGAIRIGTSGGTVVLDNVKTDVRVDGRGSEVTATIAEGAPSIAISNDGDEDMRVTPPPGGYQLDAVTREGRITVPENTVKVITSGGEQRAVGSVKGGGTLITLRAGHGDIVVRPR